MASTHQLGGKECAGNDDTIALKAEDSGDNLTLMFENEGARCAPCPLHCLAPTQYILF